LAHIGRNPILGAIASRLTNSPEIRLWHDQLLLKPPDKADVKSNVGWHTDRGYWKPCSSALMVTAWIPFHNCDEEMGTITMIDGSHRWPDNTRKLNFFSNDLEGLEREFVRWQRSDQGADEPEERAGLVSQLPHHSWQRPES
jgi:ectoine hydroxylase-related dioxygenase (phytanoyl-CoA dioxygenase family)